MPPPLLLCNNGGNFPERRYQTNGQMRRIAPAVWGVWHHAITTIAFYTRWHSTRQRVRDCDLKELAMPDLDQIKQEEQGARDQRGRFARGRSGNPAARLPRPRQNRAARLLLAGEGEARDPQSRRASARRRPGGVTAVPRTHRRAVSRTRGRIHDAANPQCPRFGGAKG